MVWLYMHFKRKKWNSSDTNWSVQCQHRQQIDTLAGVILSNKPLLSKKWQNKWNVSNLKYLHGLPKHPDTWGILICKYHPKESNLWVKWPCPISWTLFFSLSYCIPKLLEFTFFNASLALAHLICSHSPAKSPLDNLLASNPFVSTKYRAIINNLRHALARWPWISWAMQAKNTVITPSKWPTVCVPTFHYKFQKALLFSTVNYNTELKH